MLKSKNRNEKVEQDLLKQIDKDYNLSLTLNDHKQEIVNMINYLCEFHLKKLNELIDNCEKNIQSISFQQGPLIPGQILPFVGEKAASVIEDEIIVSSRIIFNFIRKENGLWC
jgi:hypothetical protein